MGGLSIWHWLIALAVLALVFGGKGQGLGPDGRLRQGHQAFKDGMKDEDKKDEPPAAPLPRTDIEREEAKR